MTGLAHHIRAHNSQFTTASKSPVTSPSDRDHPSHPRQSPPAPKTIATMKFAAILAFALAAPHATIDAAGLREFAERANVDLAAAADEAAEVTTRLRLLVVAVAVVIAVAALRSRSRSWLRLLCVAAAAGRCFCRCWCRCHCWSRCRCRCGCVRGRDCVRGAAAAAAVAVAVAIGCGCG